MSQVVVVSGSPGCGKTTVARLLGERRGRSVHLQTDDFWHAIVSGGIAPHRPESDQQNHTVVGVAATAAFGYASGGFETFVDGVVGPWMLHHYRDAAARHPEVGLHYVVLRPDQRTALRRAQERTAPGALRDAEPVVALWRQLADLGPLEHHALDSTDLTADQTADHVDRELAAGRLRLR